MGILKYLDHTNAAYQVTTNKSFVERAHLVGTGISTLTVYDGTGTDGRVVAVLSCLANSSDDVIIQDKCKDGVYVVVTTGAGLAKAILYDR